MSVKVTGKLVGLQQNSLEAAAWVGGNEKMLLNPSERHVGTQGTRGSHLRGQGVVEGTLRISRKMGYCPGSQMQPRGTAGRLPQRRCFWVLSVPVDHHRSCSKEPSRGREFPSSCSIPHPLLTKLSIGPSSQGEASVWQGWQWRVYLEVRGNW